MVRKSCLNVPCVRFEGDETSFVDVNLADAPFLPVIGTDNRLVVAAKSESSIGLSKQVMLHDSLGSADEFQTAFTKWQVVLRENQDMRILWSAT